MARLLFIDTETTGFPRPSLAIDDACQPRLVQLAAVLADEAGDEKAHASLLVRPDGWTIPPDASQVHGLTDAECATYGVDVVVALGVLRAMGRGCDAVVAHNHEFDAFVLGGEFKRARADYPLTASSFCTMLAATDVCRIPGRRGGYKWPKLAEAHRIICGCDFQDAHDAMADVRACMRIYFKLKERLAITGGAA